MLLGQLRKIGPLVNLILQVLTLLFRIYQYVSCRCCGHACCSRVLSNDVGIIPEIEGKLDPISKISHLTKRCAGQLALCTILAKPGITAYAHLPVS